MKRYPMTVTAVALSGALTLGAVPAAVAAPTNLSVQQSAQNEARSSTDGDAVGTTPGTYITLDDTTYYQHESGQGWVSEEADVDAELTAELQAEIEANGRKIDEDEANGGDGLGGEATSSDRVRSSEPGIDGAPQNGGSSDSSDVSGNISSVAGIVLPTALVIGGVTWYLNQDGQTYVTEQSRTSSAPSAEEKADSEQMLNNNAAEVTEQAIAAQTGGADAATGAQEGADSTAPAAQAGAATGAESGAETAQNVTVTQRGIAAETGNNTVPRALAGLAGLGAAVFALRRRLA